MKATFPFRTTPSAKLSGPFAVKIVSRDIAHKTEAGGVKLKVAAEDLPRALLFDRQRLRQILVNLVGNAVKFTDKGSISARVLWEKQETSSHITLIIEVQDTGVGIPKEKLEAIFKPFVQAGAHRDKERQGTGLGLAIVKRLTEMMGGTVTAASIMGQGSAFSLRFPNVAISGAEQRKTPAAESAALRRQRQHQHGHEPGHQ